MNRNIYETIKKDGFIGNIYQDDCDFNTPRDWDNIGKMICWHNRYTLGDKKLLENYSYSKDCKLSNLTENCNGWDEVEEVLKNEFDAVVILPLFLYDHSGISIRTYSHGQHAGWDGGYVGFIYATKADILKGWDKKKLTKSLLEKANKCLEGEVETYSQYLEGDVFCFTVEDADGEIVESCGGFYGMEAVKEEVNSQIDYYIKEKQVNLNNTKALVFG
jgi:hypothetical protein